MCARTTMTAKVLTPPLTPPSGTWANTNLFLLTTTQDSQMDAIVAMPSMPRSTESPKSYILAAATGTRLMPNAMISTVTQSQPLSCPSTISLGFFVDSGSRATLSGTST